MLGVGVNKKPLESGLTNRGFSLVEALVSLTLLVVAVGGFAAAFQYKVFQSVAATNYSQAKIIANSVFSELNTTYGDWNLGSLEDGFLYDFEGNRVNSRGDAHFWVDVETNPGPGWQAVTIGVTWNNSVGERDKTGFGSKNAEYAYVLEGILSIEVGDPNAPGGP